MDGADVIADFFRPDPVRRVTAEATAARADREAAASEASDPSAHAVAPRAVTEPMAPDVSSRRRFPEDASTPPAA